MSSSIITFKVKMDGFQRMRRMSLNEDIFCHDHCSLIPHLFWPIVSSGSTYVFRVDELGPNGEVLRSGCKTRVEIDEVICVFQYIAMFFEGIRVRVRARVRILSICSYI